MYTYSKTTTGTDKLTTSKGVYDLTKTPQKVEFETELELANILSAVSTIVEADDPTIVSATSVTAPEFYFGAPATGSYRMLVVGGEVVLQTVAADLTTWTTDKQLSAT